MLLGLLGGAFVGVGLAFFFEYLDNRVKTPEEIERSSASVARPDPGDGDGCGKANPLISDSAPPNFAEAFRALRTNILFSAADGGPRSIVVTSTGPSEGKTMVAGNVAIGLAQTGQRVLLIDADMRRPRAHELFGVAVEPGPVEPAGRRGEAERSRAPVSGVENLWVMPAGKTPPNPAELLGSKRFADLTASLGGHFDCIVIDTPPVLAVTDAAVVAHRASGVLFVIAADVTSRHAAQTALDQLEHAQAQVPRRRAEQGGRRAATRTTTRATTVRTTRTTTPPRRTDLSRQRR